ncbi:MAG: hypothetical protein ACHREM_15895, partial [Polyangiales bacterium]
EQVVVEAGTGLAEHTLMHRPRFAPRGWFPVSAIALLVGCGAAADGAPLGTTHTDAGHGGDSGEVVATDSGTDDAGLTNSDARVVTEAGSTKDAGGGHPGSDAAAPIDSSPALDDAGTADTTPPRLLSTQFAPYFYTWGWGSGSYAFSNLVDMKSKGGPAAVTIAFVLSDGTCKATTDIQSNLADVQAYVAAGGHVKASFGGADGKYLESGCSDAASLAKALSDFVDQTGITDLDFDIEQGSSTSNATINAMRGQALKTVQDAKDISVSFTLPVNPDGLDALGKAVVQGALDAGVKVSIVNVMTMDYGDGTSNLGSVATGSADATAKQLQSMISGLSLADAYTMVGITAMIGHNDDTEVFSLDDAKTVAAWASANKLGLLSYWAIQRDEKCPSGVDLDVCSGVNGATFDFSAVFAAVGK